MSRSSPDWIRGCRSTVLVATSEERTALRQAQGERGVGGDVRHDIPAAAALSDASFPHSARRARTSGVARFLVAPRGVFLDEGEAVRRVVAHAAIEQSLYASALHIFVRNRQAETAAARRIHCGFLALVGGHI